MNSYAACGRQQDVALPNDFVLRGSGFVDGNAIERDYA